MGMEPNEFLSHFEKVKFVHNRDGNECYKAKSPLRRDSDPSLYITVTPDRYLLCDHGDKKGTYRILDQVGLTKRDLYRNEWSPPTWQDKLEDYEKRQIEASYDYCDRDGKYLYTKVRFVGKRIRYGRINADKTFFHYGLGNNRHVLYNLPAVIRAIESGFPIYIVEGEKDVLTMKAMGLTATTAGGSGDWEKEFAPVFLGANVVILPDNDEAGRDLLEEIKRDIRLYAHSVKVVPTSMADGGDVTDYINEGHSKEDLLKLVTEAVTTYAPWINKTQQGTFRVNEGILAESIAETLPYYIVRDMNLENDDIYIYENGFYRRCNKNEFKGYIRKYLPAGMAKSYLLSAVCNNILCMNRKTKTHADFNTDENIINVKNGLVDVTQMKLLPHSPDVLTDYQLNCEFRPYAKCDRYLKFLEELCTHDGEVDHEQIAVLQEWTGLILSNVHGYRVKKALIMLSLLGNTGKTLATRPMMDILGFDRTINIPIQKLSDRFSMGDVFGKRLIFIGDQGNGQIEDSSIFKQLTGGDRVKVERKGKTGFDYFFTGCMLMVSNGLPSFTDDKGGHVFERLEISKFENVIPPDKRDPMLYDKIKPELDGIFMWGLVGLKRLTSNGYRFTNSKRNAETLQDFRETSDTLFRYISEKCEITGDTRNDRIKKTDFEDDYEKWCVLEQLNGVQKRNIRVRMESYGIPPGPYHGYDCYKGIRYQEKHL